MAAFVDIAAAPVLVLLLFLIDVDSFSNPLVLPSLLVSTGMSLKSLHTLIKQICHGAPLLPLPGMAAKSGSGMVRVDRALPCSATGGAVCWLRDRDDTAVLCNRDIGIDQPEWYIGRSGIIQSTPGISWNLYLTQALTATGAMVAPIILLIAIYLLYLNLGRRFIKQNAPKKGFAIGISSDSSTAGRREG